MDINLIRFYDIPGWKMFQVPSEHYDLLVISSFMCADCAKRENFVMMDSFILIFGVC